MPSVAEFLIERLGSIGIKHCFGLPGDYVLNFYKKLSDSKQIEIINCTDENHAGFAADAYARVNGAGCVCVTYNVGALKIANAVACAYAERSPLVVISGSPGLNERKEGMLLHHMVRSFECQKDIFENITCASVVLDDPSRAGYDIDRVLHKLQEHKQPVYIELPRDVADKPINYDVYKQGTPKFKESDRENLVEALEEVKAWISTAKNPVILAGVQLARFGLGAELVKFAEKANIPICSTLLAKSVVGEDHPLFRGIYMGSSSQKDVQQLVEDSDCLLMFGVLLTDMTLNFRPAKFQKRQVVSCSVEALQVKNHAFTNVLFKDFCMSLFKSEIARKDYVVVPRKNIVKFEAQPDALLTSPRFFEKLNTILTEDMAIVADVGDCLFGAADLFVRNKNHFISPAFYTSMGASIPGSLGFQVAKPNVRPIVLVGDGAFQMCCTELSTIANRKLNPIVFIINNDGYATERQIVDGPFNDIASWSYHKITEVVGGIGARVTTEAQLEEILPLALRSDCLFVIDVVVRPDVVSEGLKRMSEGLKKK